MAATECFCNLVAYLGGRVVDQTQAYLLHQVGQIPEEIDEKLAPVTKALQHVKRQIRRAQVMSDQWIDEQTGINDTINLIDDYLQTANCPEAEVLRDALAVREQVVATLINAINVAGLNALGAALQAVEDTLREPITDSFDAFASINVCTQIERKLG